jgi:hypothetical protein
MSNNTVVVKPTPPAEARRFLRLVADIILAHMIIRSKAQNSKKVPESDADMENGIVWYMNKDGALSWIIMVFARYLGVGLGVAGTTSSLDDSRTASP